MTQNFDSVSIGEILKSALGERDRIEEIQNAVRKHSRVDDAIERAIQQYQRETGKKVRRKKIIPLR